MIIVLHPFPFEEGQGQRLEIYNTLGSPIYSGKITNKKTEINLREQPSGIYFIRIGKVIKKIIKE